MVSLHKLPTNFLHEHWQPGTRDQEQIAIEVGRRRMGQQGHGKGREVEQIAFFEEEENTAETTSPLASLHAMESRFDQPPVSSEQCASPNLRSSANATSKNMCPLLIEGGSCGQRTKTQRVHERTVQVLICRLIFAGESSRRCPWVFQQRLGVHRG